MTKDQIKRDQTLRALNRIVTEVYNGGSRSKKTVIQRFNKHLADIKAEGGYTK